MLVYLVITMSLLWKRVSCTEFVVGRIRFGQYEYPEMNGWFTPWQAKFDCERDEICAGFTYKGLHPDYSRDMDLNYNTFFFRFIPAIDRMEPRWVSYRSTKAYAYYNGTFEEHNIDRTIPHMSFNDCDMDRSCVGLIKGFFKGARVSRKLSYVQLDSFSVTVEFGTWIKLSSGNSTLLDSIDMFESYIDTSGMCTDDVGYADRVKGVLATANTYDLVKVTCSEFNNGLYEDFIYRRQPFVIQGCLDHWLNQKEWTFKQITRSLRHRRWDWTVDNPRIRIKDQIKKNFTLSLYNDFWYRSVPFRLQGPFFEINGLGKTKKRIEVDQQETGKSLQFHEDWLDKAHLLMTGEKYWLILHSDLDPSEYLPPWHACANGTRQQSFDFQWYHAVMPYLRRRRVHGRDIVSEFLQYPGEILVIPHKIAYANLNTQPTTSVTRTFFSKQVSSLSEWVNHVTRDIVRREKGQFVPKLLDQKDMNDRKRKLKNIYNLRSLDYYDRRVLRAIVKQMLDPEAYVMSELARAETAWSK